MNLTVNANTLFANAALNRVGINTITPGSVLTVIGDLNVTDADIDLFVDVSADAVGIGTATPDRRLTVLGSQDTIVNLSRNANNDVGIEYCNSVNCMHAGLLFRFQHY